MNAEFLDLIYASIVDNRLWGDVLQRVSHGMGGEGAALIWQDVTTNVPGGVISNLDPESLDLFTAYFATRNPLRPTEAEVRRQLSSWTPKVILDEDRLPKEEFIKTEFYNDYFRRFDFHSSAAIGLHVEGVHGGTLDVVRNRRNGAFTDEEMRFAKQAQPHLARAFRLTHELAAAGGSGRDLAVGLEHSSAGVFVLSRDGRIQRMNPAAEAYAGAGDRVRVVGGRLVGADHYVDRRLAILIGKASSPDVDLRSGGFMTVVTSADTLPLAIHVTPLPATGLALFDSPSVLVRITDPQRTDLPSPEKLREVFRLTATEAKVALALFEGLQTPEVARRMGSSVNTIRNHLARILDKTHSSGQAELSRRLMGLL